MTKKFNRVAMYKYQTLDNTHSICSTDWGDTWEVHQGTGLDNEGKRFVESRLGRFHNLRNAKRFLLKLKETLDS